MSEVASTATSSAAADRPLGAGVRGEFPILQQEQDGRRLVYLDSAATSQKPAVVIDTLADFYRQTNANIHRGTYTISQRATELFEGARERIAEFTGADPRATVFTRNVTEAINLVANCWGRDNLGPGDVVLVTEMEHHSNIVPWQLIGERTGATLEYVPITDDHVLDIEALDARLAVGDVKMLAVVHVSNVLGTINDVAEIVRRGRAAGAATLVDGAQAVPQMPVDVGAIGADFYVWTGHKAYAPNGAGVLHSTYELLTQLPPWLGGGDMIKTVEWDCSTWNDPPWKYEAGTSAVGDVVALGTAVDFLSAIGMDAVRAHERSVTEYALERLAEVPGLALVGPDAARRGGVVSFTLAGIHPHDIGELCNRHAVCVRTGHHCAQPLMRRLGVPATARASFGVYSDRDDVDALVDSLLAARGVFGLAAS
jgi:cysteine desulfurase/selenocysteine lyase